MEKRKKYFRILVVYHIVASIVLTLTVIIAAALKVDALLPRTTTYPAYDDTNDGWSTPHVKTLSSSLNVLFLLFLFAHAISDYSSCVFNVRYFC